MEPLRPLRLFLCHSSGDKEEVRDLYQRLRKDGFEPWLDETDILPGRAWEREITAAVRKSDIAIVCLSRDSINKKGFVQKEIKHALDVADERPEGRIFIIPLKLEECDVPLRLGHLQWVNLFEENGYEKLLASLRTMSGDVAAFERAGEPSEVAEGGRGYVGGHREPKTTNRPLFKEGLRDLFTALLFITCVLALKLAVEQTTAGKRLTRLSYDLLQRTPPASPGPVTVVDISALQPAAFDVDGQTGIVTPREPLQQMIEAIAEGRPKAIGVTIDFSPERGEYLHPRDPEFFQFCLNLRRQKGVPVFLGIYRSRDARPEKWLKAEDYQDLAASLLMPWDSERMLSELQLRGEGEAGRLAEAYRPSRSMSVVLADAYGRESGYASRWSRRLVEELRNAGFVEQISDKHLDPRLTVTDFLIDFSQIESIEAGTIKTINPLVLRDQSRQGRFNGKVVLIGSAAFDDTEDLNPVPGQKPYPSIYIHACAAYTMIQAPLYAATGTGRVVINILFWLMLLAPLILLRLCVYGVTGGAAMRRLRRYSAPLLVVAALVVGAAFVGATRVRWNDFLLAPALLVFQPSLELRLRHLQKQLMKRASVLSGRHTFNQDGGRHDED